MNWYKNQKTMTKLLLGYLLVALIMAVVAYVGYSGMQGIGAGATLIYEQNLTHISLLADTQNDMAQVREHTVQAVLHSKEADGASHAAEEAKKATESADAIPKLIAEQRALDLGSDEKAQLGQFEAAWNDYKGLTDKALQLVSAGKGDEALAAIDSAEADKHYEDAGAALALLHATNEDEALEHHNEGESTAERSTFILLGAAIAGVILAITLGYFIARMIAGPLQRMTRSLQALAEDVGYMEDATSQIASGDLTASVSINSTELDIQSKDEVGQTASAFNSMITRLKGTGEAFNEMASELRSLVGDIRQSAQSVATSSQQLSAAADQSSSASQQVATTIQQVARGSQDQSASVQETQASIEQLS
ncbi:MAG: MCP four helix bundle domain-containing protein, partial [Chloroflexi bacterium]|nr:MCP four helix bundle domain-containing protein [Chloroflexota bacterium]